MPSASAVEHGQRRESGALAQHAKAETQVLEQAVHEHQDAKTPQSVNYKQQEFMSRARKLGHPVLLVPLLRLAP
jgi:hypothetical protein